MFVTRYTKEFLIAGLLIVVVAGGIVLSLGIPLGIDFTGGALTEVSYDVRPEKASLDQGISSLELGDYSLRAAGESGYILRTRDLSDEERVSLQNILLEGGDGSTIERFTSIGPVIGNELKAKALWALGAVALIIVLYVAFVFRKVSKPVGSWVYGGIAILVLVHDVLVPTAVISLLGYFAGIEADVLFVMALLAVLGYSVNDTIVVFDRVRENLKLYRNEHERVVEETGVKRTETTYSLTKPFGEIVGLSVKETLARSINTSVTTFLALTALYFFGGEVTKTFALMLMAGVIAGTYSSICIANPLLIAIANRQSKKS